MKKILFLINTLGDGGAERVLVDTANHLDKSLFSVTVQTVIDVGARREELSSDVRYKTVISVRSRILRKLLSNIVYKILPARWTYRLFIKDDYDIEIAFLEGFPTKIIAASDNLSAEKIAWVHTDLMSYFDSSAVFSSFRNNKSAYEAFDRIVGVSDDVGRRFCQRFNWKKDNVFTVYNVNDDARIRSQAVEPIGIDSQKKIIRLVSCGRLVEQKGYDRLLRIHKRLINEGLTHELWIVGEGGLRGQLEAFIKENSLSDTVTLWGFQKNPYKYIMNSDCFVCSSRDEGYNTAVTEACILGIPVLTTNISGATEPEECPRYSILCENDENSLYLAIKSVLLAPEKLERYRKEMSAKSSFFGTDSQIERLQEFLASGQQ